MGATIWESALPMTIINLLIIAFVGGCLWTYLKGRKALGGRENRLGFVLLVSGLVGIGLFHAVNLFILHVLPIFVPPAEARVALEQLHLNFRWLMALVGVGALSLGFLITNRDLLNILERHKAAAEAQRKGQEQLDLIANNVPALIAYIDAGQRYRFVNQTFLDWHDRSRGEVIGKRISEVHNSVIYDRAKPFFGAVLRGEAQSVERRYRYRDGTERDVIISMTPHEGPGGKILGAFILTLDRSERKRAEALAARSAQRVQAVMDNAADGIITIDRAGIVESFNRTAETLFGYSADEIIGRNVKVLMPVMYSSEHDDYINHYVDTGDSKIIEKGPREVKGQRKDGSVFDMDLAVSEMHLDDQTLFIGLVRDISERKRTEQVLNQALKMEAVGQLTGGIAHDFNNILAVILGNIELSQEQLGTGSPVAKLLDNAVGSARRGADLTQRLLAYSRQQILAPRVCDLGDIVAGMIELLHRTLGEHIEIVSSLAADLWACKVDPTQTESALLNLVLNARDAMPQGGKLTIGTANETVGPEASGRGVDLPPGDYVTLAVTDTGSGIAKENLANIFEPFFTTKPVGKGSGLGLSMIFGFVKQSGGDITVDSRVGEGTTFRIFLPRTRARPAEPLPGAAANGADHLAAARAGETVLVVEDDADLRAVVVSQLDALGYRVIEAASGPSALELLKQGESCDLLLTDIVLPERMSGPELVAAMRRQGSDAKALYMSGYACKALDRAPDLDRDVPLLRKPFARRDLATNVRAALDGRA